MWKFCRKHPGIVLCFVVLQVVLLSIAVSLTQGVDADYQRMGRTLNGIEVLLSFLVLLIGVFGPTLYFLPTFLAYRNRQRDFKAIALTNLLAGWTIVGWIVAIVWSVTESGRLPPEPIIVAPSKADLWYEQNRKWALPLFIAALLVGFYLITHIS